MSGCHQVDDTFGPHASACRGGFDFTLLFEESLLIILPLALFLVCTLFRILYLMKKETKVVRNKLIILKVVSATVIFYNPIEHSMIEH